MGNLDFDTIPVEDSVRLEAPFLEKEVIEALGGTEGNKALDPNGFSIAFFQHCWVLLK